MNTVLITGATGTVGSQLIPLFVENPDTTVYLLIRADGEAQLTARFEKLLRYLDLAPTPRLIPVIGDVSKPDLGLGEMHRKIAEECTHVVHAAASIKLNLSPAAAEEATLNFTRNILRFCFACTRFRKLEYVSTIGVAGRMKGKIPERPLTEPREFHNYYEHFKARAEAEVIARMQEGFPATIHRPSMIVGDVREGRIIHFQGFYLLTRFFAGLMTAGILPRLPRLTLDTVPVDYVARGIHFCAMNEDAARRILHYSSAEHSLSAHDFAQLVQAEYRRGGRRVPTLRYLPVHTFDRLVRGVRALCWGRPKRKLGHLQVFMRYLDNDQIFENRETTALLSAHGITQPHPREYLPRTVDYYLKQQERKGA